MRHAYILGLVLYLLVLVGEAAKLVLLMMMPSDLGGGVTFPAPASSLLFAYGVLVCLLAVPLVLVVWRVSASRHANSMTWRAYVDGRPPTVRLGAIALAIGHASLLYNVVLLLLGWDFDEMEGVSALAATLHPFAYAMGIAICEVSYIKSSKRRVPSVA